MRSVLLLLALTLAADVASGQGKVSPTLYERLGRYDGIAKIADEYLKGVRADPQFARFSGRGADSLSRARQLLKDQWCALTGGPCVYIGRDMRTAHGGLGITEADWSASVKYMAGALEKCHVSGTDRDEFLALIESFRQHIVEKDAAKK
jgi:hemoglobin